MKLKEIKLTEKERWMVIKEHQKICKHEGFPLESWEYIPFRAKLMETAATLKALKKILEYHDSSPVAPVFLRSVIDRLIKEMESE